MREAGDSTRIPTIMVEQGMWGVWQPHSGHCLMFMLKLMPNLMISMLQGLSLHQLREKEKEVCTGNRGLPSIVLPFRSVSRWTYGMRGLIYH